MRLVDIALGLPIILMALVFVAALGPSFTTVIVIITVFLWSRYARQIRGRRSASRSATSSARARVAGASHFRIMFRYILPNVVNTLIVLATLQLGFVILLEYTLAFLRGHPAPDASLGDDGGGWA